MLIANDKNSGDTDPSRSVTTRERASFYKKQETKFSIVYTGGHLEDVLPRPLSRATVLNAQSPYLGIQSIRKNSRHRAFNCIPDNSILEMVICEIDARVSKDWRAFGSVVLVDNGV